MFVVSHFCAALGDAHVFFSHRYAYWGKRLSDNVKRLQCFHGHVVLRNCTLAQQMECFLNFWTGLSGNEPVEGVSKSLANVES